MYCNEIKTIYESAKEEETEAAQGVWALIWKEKAKNNKEQIKSKWYLLGL